MIGLYSGIFIAKETISVNITVSANFHLSGLVFSTCGDYLLFFIISIVNFFLLHLYARF